MTNPEQYAHTEYKGVPISIERDPFHLPPNDREVVKVIATTKHGIWILAMEVSSHFLRHKQSLGYLATQCYESFKSKNSDLEW